MELETPTVEETVKLTANPSSRLRPSRTGFFSSISPPSARSSFAVAPGRASTQTDHESHPQPHKAERVAMEEVRRQLVQFDLPPAKQPIHNPETGV